MPVAKLTASDGLDVMKTEDRIDTIIRQAVGKEPFYSFPRASDSPVQWIQLLHGLDQQELPGWPLLYPLKVQLQKCDKCSREFCSPINYRRHIRVHHRLKKLDKDSTKNRDLLGAYWDKLSVEEAKEVLSFEDVMLEEEMKWGSGVKVNFTFSDPRLHTLTLIKEVPGSSILEALTTLIHRPGFSTFPQYYLRAGAALWDIIQSKPSSFPLSSQQLFSILDDASEKTCLCGSAVSMQKYVFDGEAGKICLEPKNLVACTSYLLEQKLVKAWLADKDAEALRCQRQLVEEEEAAQKRQAEQLERKRRKKLRQKDQKARGKRHEAEIKGDIDSTVEVLSAVEASLGTYDFEAHNPDTFADGAPSLVPFQCPDTSEGNDGDGIDLNIERRSAHGHNRRRTAVARQQGLPKSQWAVANGLHVCQNSSISKIEVIQKYGTQRDQKAAAIVNGSKVWSRKSKPEIDTMVSEARVNEGPDQVKNHEVLIGSISIALDNYSQSEGNAVASQEDCIVEDLANQNCSQDKPMRPDFVQSASSRSTVKLWRPVSRHEAENPFPIKSGETEADAINGNGDCQNLSGPSCSRSCSTDGSEIGSESNFSHAEGRFDRGPGPGPGPASLQFSSHAAKAFLAQRWKEAMSSDHVELVVSSDSEPPGRQEIQEVDRCNNLTNTENRLPATSKVTKAKPRTKPVKGTKTKYIPKQKKAT